MEDIQRFALECKKEIAVQGGCTSAKKIANDFVSLPQLSHYVYHFSWLGRPIIQFPQDIVAMHEIVFETKPDLIIETGIAHGGSLIFYSSLLELNAICGGPEQFRVLGIDIDIRDHNRAAIENHPIYKRGKISLLQGSSISPEIIAKVHDIAKDYRKILVCLDSNHTHEHVLSELNAYHDLVSEHSYLVVFDTFVEFMPADAYPDRPWGKGNNPMTAVREFLSSHPEFKANTEIDNKLLISAAPGGYLRRL